ncbi:hypothetical protein ASD24_24935, partial [Paenibacillus sp. Root52]|uniref:DGQHR domain-containing protein n=1 Tax=Paenibacillus sp. Root52 TaxID=1736552 RepID=UPI0007023CEC
MAKKNNVNAISYSWNTKNCYSGFMSYNDVKRYVNLVKDQSMNRLINDTSVDMILKYMKEEQENIFFPPVIMNSSGKINYDLTTYKLALEDSSLTIIDGQHRIKAINELLDDPNFKNDFNKMKIPFLIIEELSPELHRKLFHTINDKSTKVQNNVSDRFSTTTSNLIGLRYVSENLVNREYIEWEGKQSKEKIVYSHILNCIEKIEDFIGTKFEDELKYLNFVVVENKNHYYKDNIYFEVFSKFWNYIFKKIANNPQEIGFYVKDVVLSTITKTMLDNLQSVTIEELKNEIEDTIDAIIPNELIFDYVFRINKSTECTESLMSYLQCNKQLNQAEIRLTNRSVIKKILSKVIPNDFLNSAGYFTLEKKSVQEFGRYLKFIDEFISKLLEEGKEMKEIINTLNNINVIN